MSLPELRVSSDKSSTLCSRDSISAQSTQSLLRVGIVGGGLAGLTLAQLLRLTPDIHVTVYERSKDAIDRLCGYSVMLSLHLMSRMHKKLPKEVWAKVLQSRGVQPGVGQELAFMKSDGRRIITFDSEEMRDKFSVSRWKLREALLDSSKQFVKFGKVFKEYEELLDGTYELHFGDGTIAHCDILVGADGMNSKVRKQLVPSAGLSQAHLAVIYLKIPYTQATRALLPTPSGSIIFCSRNQHIVLHSWMNPMKPMATVYDDYDIAADESFIMFGYGSRLDEFINQTKHPSEFSSAELFAECLMRVRLESGLHPNIAALANQCVINTAYLHVVKESDPIKKWKMGSATLIGDAVFNMPTILGKGANCGILDALDLAEVLQKPDMLSVTTRSVELRKVAAENIKRRLRERHRNALIQSVVYFGGDNALTSFCRNQSLKMALDWIDDPRAAEFHSKGS